MNEPEIQTDVAIVGGGLAGLSLAIGLARHGLKVVAVDREDPDRALAAEFDGRVSAIALASQRLLDAIGVWPHVAEAQPMWDIRVTDGDSPLFLHYDHADVGPEPFGWMVENRVMRRAQQDALAALPSLTLLAPMGVAEIDQGQTGSGAGASLRLQDGRRIRCRLIVGADGRQSFVRQAAGIGVAEWGYDQTGIVCTVAHAISHRGVAQERFLPPGPFAILPMTDAPDGRHRSSLVWCEPPERAAALLALPTPAFEAEMATRFGDHFGPLSLVGPRWSYPLNFILAEAYLGERLVLVGDAAHGIHPIAGQGLNLGLRDVAALIEVLVDAARLGQDIGQFDVLERYARWRRVDAVVVSAVMDGLTRLFSNDVPPIRLARRLGLAAVEKLPPLKKVFMRHAMGDLGQLPKLLRGQPV